MKKAILCGYYGYGNGGDEALLATLLQMLPREVEPIILSGNPMKTQEQYGVKSYARMKVFDLFKVFREGDIFIWGGGSLIQDSTSLKSALYYTTLMKFAQKKGLKTIAWAQGIGPLNYPITRQFARSCFRECDGISVRDQGSAFWLKNWQIPFSLAPDPVWVLSALRGGQLEGLPTPRVAVNLRSHGSLTSEKLTVLTEALIRFQQVTKTFIILVPFQESQDLKIAKHLQKALSENSQIISLENPRELKGLFQQVDLLIGMRLHSLIMAASERCKCFALSYDPKVTHLMEELAIPGLILTDLPSEADRISQEWIREYYHGKSLSYDRINSLMKDALIHQDILTKLGE